MTARSTINYRSHAGRDYTLDVNVYETRYEAAAEFPANFQTGIAAFTLDESVDAVTVRSHPGPHRLGVLQLIQGRMSHGLVAHEVVHAAQWLYRLDVIPESEHLLAEAHFTVANEVFAHMVSDLLRNVAYALDEQGYSFS